MELSIDRVYPLNEFKKAFSGIESSNQLGNIGFFI